MSTESVTDWTTPTVVSDVLMAFPGSVSHLMPPREECEAALAAMKDKGERWRQFQRDWFFKGLPENTTARMREGIDGETAFRHLSAIQGSFEPKHQHKEAAVAYLASLWLVKPPKTS